ncbi:uncharacterized protein RAG0_03244 [Rhynchosporium agropyri]|uniref:Uncharacterized protein n=1 Tax=Rhynchosporium agropyri TaxID=914238 RepID=A0A1E1K3T8_9HELO|nr:uncharacterized protein RAG0_03244 [Rhynchosporium agropyri]
MSVALHQLILNLLDYSELFFEQLPIYRTCRARVLNLVSSPSLIILYLPRPLVLPSNETSVYISLSITRELNVMPSGNFDESSNAFILAPGSISSLVGTTDKRYQNLHEGAGSYQVNMNQK